MQDAEKQEIHAEPLLPSLPEGANRWCDAPVPDPHVIEFGKAHRAMSLMPTPATRITTKMNRMQASRRAKA